MSLRYELFNFEKGSTAEKDSVHLCCSEGGFFKGVLTFPKDYPNSPPEFRFTSEMWHPNGVFLCWFISGSFTVETSVGSPRKLFVFMT